MTTMTTMTTQGTFGAALDAAMQDAGVPIKALSRTSGIPVSTLYAYRNATRHPPEDQVDVIATALRVDAGTRSRLYAAAGYAVEADLPTLAADLVRGLPTAKDRLLAIELLRTQSRVYRRQRRETRAVIAEEIGAIEALSAQEKEGVEPPVPQDKRGGGLSE